MTSTEANRSIIDESKLKPDHRMVLDFLCRQPARIFAFDEVAAALKQKRIVVERAFSALKRHQYGAFLPMYGPHGEVLRPRHAWLPPDAPVRDLYPPLEHPPLPPPRARVVAPSRRVSAVRAQVMHDEEAARAETLKARKLARQQHRMVVVAERAAEREERNAKRDEARRQREEQAALMARAQMPQPTLVPTVPAKPKPAKGRMSE